MHSNRKILNIVYLFVVLVVLNFISSMVYVRADITANHRYTISKATRRVLSDLKDIVVIKVFFSKQLPSELLPVKNQVQDLLEEYRVASHGKLHIMYIDPTKSRQLAREAISAGVQPVQMNVYQKDQLQMIRGYFGLAIFYGDKKESIPIIKNANGLEYELTSRIMRLSEGKNKLIGFVFDGGNHSFDKDYSRVKKTLSKIYSVKALTDSTLEPVDMLVVAGIGNLQDSVLHKIESDYIDKGVPVIMLADGADIGTSAFAKTFPMDKLAYFARYGFKINPDLVLDRSCEMAPFKGQYFIVEQPYPLWIKILPQGFNEKVPFVRGLKSLMLPWASSLDLTKTKGLDIKPFIKTSSYAWTQKGALMLNPQFIKTPNSRDAYSSYALAAYITGSPAFLKDTTVNIRLLVISNSKFLEDRYTAAFPSNLVLFANAVDYMCFSKGGLSSIRLKTNLMRPIKPLSLSAKNTVKYFNIIGMPILFILLGLIFNIRRKKRLAKIQEEMQ